MARSKNALDTLNAEIKTLESEVSALRQDVKELVKHRSKKRKSLDTIIESIMHSHGVQICAYHGGTLTGKSIQTLFSRWDIIMDKVLVVCEERLKQRRQEEGEEHVISNNEFETKMQEHRDLALIQNGMYAYLRKESPTQTEKSETRKRIAAMEKIWKAMTFSITPKAHALFAHAADDQDIFDGIGDKVEDPIEKRHQTQAQYDQMLQRAVGGGYGTLKCQATYEWMYSDPAVNNRVRDVHVASSNTPEEASSSQSSKDESRKKLPRVSQRDRLTKMVVTKFEEDDASEVLVWKPSFENL